MRSSTSQFLTILTSASLASSAVIPGTSWNPSTVLKRASLTGQATYYGGNVQGGACSFSTYTLPAGIYGTALSDSNWATAAECGACVEVTGPSGNSVTAMIVDECPGCGENHLDLFPTAFTALAAASKGIIDVTWTYTTCPITTPLQLHNKEGVSAYWFSMQVVNANEAITSLEVSTDSGSTWASTTRSTYNFFENQSGFGTTTVDVKVTGISGDVIIVNDVTVESGGSVAASANFAGGSGAATGSGSSAAAATSSVGPSKNAMVAVETTSTSSSVPVASTSSISSSSALAFQTPSSAVKQVTTTSSSSTSVSSTPLPSSSSTKTTSLIMVTVTGTKPGFAVPTGGDSCSV